MKTYTIKEISEYSGLTHPTLRYYEQIGLLTNVIHEGNKRIYTDEHIRRIDGILCFKRTNMPVNKILDFYRYEENLENNIEPIVELLTTHEADIENQIATLEDNLKHIKHKVWFYKTTKEAIDKGQQLPLWEDFPE